jgi:PAT family beta-lactamase induction signal transducer AmpG
VALRLHRFVDIFKSRRLAILTALGFASGMPLIMTGTVLSAWMTDEKINIKTIGAFASVGIPYSFKFAWAPLLDRYALPFLGRRRGWVLLFQILLIGAIATMGFVGTTHGLVNFAAIAVVVAALSASQDVVLDAYANDILAADQRAAGTSMYTFGYKIALFFGTVVTLILADHIVFPAIYMICAAMMLVGVVATLLAEEPTSVKPPRTIVHAVVEPFAELLDQGWRIVVVFLFVPIFRIGDLFTNSLLIPFVHGNLGISFTQIAELGKTVGLAATISGAAIATMFIARYGLRMALLVFGALQASTLLLWALLATVGKNLALYSVVVFTDTLGGQLGQAAFVAYLMSRLDRRVSATQYALLTSLSSIGTRFFGYEGGALQSNVGWPMFFVVMAAIMIPGLLLIPFLPMDDRLAASDAKIATDTPPAAQRQG